MTLLQSCYMSIKIKIKARIISETPSSKPQFAVFRLSSSQRLRVSVSKMLQVSFSSASIAQEERIISLDRLSPYMYASISS